MNQLTSQVRPESVLPLKFKRLKGIDLDVFEYFFLNGKQYVEVYHTTTRFSTVTWLNGAGNRGINGSITKIDRVYISENFLIPYEGYQRHFERFTGPTKSSRCTNAKMQICWKWISSVWVCHLTRKITKKLPLYLKVNAKPWLNIKNICTFFEIDYLRHSCKFTWKIYAKITWETQVKCLVTLPESSCGYHWGISGNSQVVPTFITWSPFFI